MLFVRTLAVCTAAFFLACSGSEPAPSPPNPVDVGGFVEGDWHPGASLRRVGTAYRERIQRLVALPNGGVAVLRHSADAQHPFDPTSIVETFDAAGSRVASATTPDETMVIDLAVHPSGELTLVEMHKDSQRARGQVWLRRLAPDLRTIAEAPLRDRPSEHERLAYRFERQPNGPRVIRKIEMQTVPEDGIVALSLDVWNGGHFLLAPRGEESILSAWSYGAKVYALGADLGVRWSRQVMPRHSFMNEDAPEERLTVDEKGRIAVAIPIDLESVEAYKRHFAGEHVVWSGAFFQSLVTRIAADGQDAASRIFGHAENGDWSARGVALRGDDVILCGSVRLNGKFKEPNHTREWDLAWLRGNLTGGTKETRIIDVQRDDVANECKVDAEGNIVFAGVNDFVQVDTDSWVESGQGLLFAVDSSGREISRTILRGPRQTKILAFDWSRDGRAYFGGIYDGPISHTPTAEYGEKAMLGVVSVRPSRP